MKCMILAAGLGTRLRPITNKIPKPAVELLNVPLMYYTGELIRAWGPSQIVVNSHLFPEQIEHMTKILGFPYVMSPEKEKPLGSGGGLKHAQKYLESETFLAVNADNAIIPHNERLIENLWQAHQDAKDPLATLLVVEDPRVGKEFNGVWFNEKHELREITKQPANRSLNGMHFTGIAVYSPRIFKYLRPGESNIFADAIIPALGSGERVMGYSDKLTWLETGDPKNYLASTHLLLQKYDSMPFLQKLVRKYSPDSNYKKENGEFALFSSTSKIAHDCSTTGFLVIGKNTEIQSGASVSNSVVLPGGKCAQGQKYHDQIIL